MTTLKNIYGGVNQNSDKRRLNDFYPTPPLAIYAFMKEHKNFPRFIIEPCAGNGYISRQIGLMGDEYSDVVKSYDIELYKDPLVYIEKKDMFDHNYKGYGIITNPPYKEKMPQKLIEKALSDGCKFIALVLRTTFLESAGRHTLFSKYPPSDIYVFSDRMNCDFTDDLEKKQIGGMVSYSVFVWDSESNNTSKIHWIKLKDYYDEWNRTYLQYFN